MTTESEYWLVFAGLIAVLIVIESGRRFFRSRPCWFFGHKMKHLSIEVRRWNTGHGNCGLAAHPFHYNSNCYITRWICEKESCGTMGFYCAGEQGKGCWTIQHGKIVPDEKEWMKW